MMRITVEQRPETNALSRVVEEVSQSSSIARLGKDKGFIPRPAGARSCSVAASLSPVPIKGGFGMKQEEMLKKVDGALADLETALQSGESETLKGYLRFLSRFHNYSFGNILLIYMQCPDASFVAGFQKWKELGRHVMKGEKGIRILAPLVRKKMEDDGAQKLDNEGRPERVVTGFRAVSVFDVTQTDGDELPSVHSYSGEPAENLDRLKTFIESKSIELIFEAPLGGALGVSEKGTIRVRPDLDSARTFAVLAHEVAHELLHKGERRKETTTVIRETEAEAVAFAVCEAVGIESNGGASDYIQLHQGDVEKFRQSLDVIRLTASEILSALEVSVEPVAV